MYPGVFVYRALKIPSPTLSRTPFNCFDSFSFLNTDKSAAPNNRVKTEQNNDCVLKMSSFFGVGGGFDMRKTHEYV